MSDHTCVTLHFYRGEAGSVRVSSDDIKGLALEGSDLDAMAQELGRILMNQARRRLAPADVE